MKILNQVFPLIASMVFTGCRGANKEIVPVSGSWANTIMPGNKVSDKYENLIFELAKGDSVNWNILTQFSYLQGESREAVGVLYAELLVNSPGIYLNRYLEGDKEAIKMAQLGWRYCAVVEHIYPKLLKKDVQGAIKDYLQLRYQMAPPSKRLAIKNFINEITGIL